MPSVKPEGDSASWIPELSRIPAVGRLVDLALDEDIGSGDLTTWLCVGPQDKGKGVIVSRETLVVAGLEVAREVFTRLDPDIRFHPVHTDGTRVEEGTEVVVLEGRLRALLTGERTALNFLQRLSGVATHVRAFVERLGGSGVQLVDTRKTTPGWRTLEKYAVRVGGARNHRFGLYDGILIKDNHIACCGGIRQAVDRIRRLAPHTIRIEVEVETLDEVGEALDSGADVIMLDNMSDEQIARAVEAIGGKALIEVSGGVTLERLERLSVIEIDVVSVGALTHAARSVDLSMDIEAL
ncbi:carboxylating nicotinate-nucleotide diphosphorylase [Thermodesulfobacteriota bacterium]